MVDHPIKYPPEQYPTQSQETCRHVSTFYFELLGLAVAAVLWSHLAGGSLAVLRPDAGGVRWI